MVQKFLRRPAVRGVFGYGNTEFWQAQKEGRISPPDAWLGPRTPVWLESTVEKDQERLLAAPRPVETRPSRRRKTNNTGAA
jgi:predicted DNA-binding transcriptional regulator AlpA